jgi:hypothetical protein
MTENMTVFFLALNFAHFLGDYTPLNRWFIAAKRYGTPVWLVAGHGAVNGALYGVATGLLSGMKAAMFAFAFETVAHTLIDVLKGRIARRFPATDDSTKAVYWTVAGADQLLHQTVLIFIVYICI